ncbi:unnamed protein product, partial [Closterium sp. NIES-54]
MPCTMPTRLISSCTTHSYPHLLNQLPAVLRRPARLYDISAAAHSAATAPQQRAPATAAVEQEYVLQPASSAATSAGAAAGGGSAGAGSPGACVGFAFGGDHIWERFS